MLPRHEMSRQVAPGGEGRSQRELGYQTLKERFEPGEHVCTQKVSTADPATMMSR